MNKRLMVLLFMGLSLSLAGCNRTTDNTESTTKTLTILPITQGEYKDVVWIEDDLIALSYRSQPQFTAGGFQPVIYNLETNDQRVIEFPLVSDEQNCRNPGARILGKGYSGNIGFVEECSYGNEIVGTKYSLIVLGQENSVIVNSFEYGKQFIPSTFSVSPSQSQFLQEEGAWNSLHSKIFLMDFQGNSQALVSDFFRARAPAWSLDGKQIAFVGTQSYDKNVDELRDIDQLMSYPWDLYLLTLNDMDPKIVYKGIQFARGVKWLAGGNYLSFSGRIDNQDGIWMLNLETQALIRVWPYQEEAYDWSPDGQKMIIITKNVEHFDLPHLIIIETGKFES